MGCLGRRGVECDAQLTHESDLFLSSQTDSEPSLWLVGVAEVIKERVKDVVHVLERQRVKPDVLLPWRIGQSQDDGYDVDSVVRYETGAFAHGG
ncbi:hypothetical protein AQJ67_15070 [Streptomyces caeruleatus]|uniref:Uncharacterized protein n=1 Tax=Streptomyces caeruleatus TaxID=661399 RepID=A0A101U3Q8_9ACTN|nr:hypothetical protein AQJ67_15070 [Streptomyces caeruleatus]